MPEPTYTLRYRPGSPLGRKFPLARFPWSRGLSPAEVEQLLEACVHKDQLEVVEHEGRRSA